MIFPSAHRITTAPIQALGSMLQLVPDALHSRVAGRLASRLLAVGMEENALQPLDGKRVWISITDTGNCWRFCIVENRLCHDPQGIRPDVQIHGNLNDFLLLATRAEDPDTLFFARRLTLEGETESGLYLRNLLDSLEFDLEALLCAVMPREASRVLALILEGTGLDRLPRSMARRLQRALHAHAVSG